MLGPVRNSILFQDQPAPTSCTRCSVDTVAGAALVDRPRLQHNRSTHSLDIGDSVKPIRLIQLAFLSAFLLVVAACGGGSDLVAETPTVDLAGETRAVSVNGGTYTDVSARGLVTKLENKDFVLVNVHIPYAGEIDGTDTFIPFDKIMQNLGELPTDKNAQVVVYCRSGGMSAIAAAELVQQGYTDVWNLDGGMIAWAAEGELLLQKDT